MDPERRKAIHQAMVRLFEGDRTAFDVLIDELWPVILSFAQRGMGHHTDAEDVAQEVFFKICSRIAEFDCNRDGLSWAFGIASYEVMTARRRKLRRREVLDTYPLTAQIDPSTSQEEQLLEREIMVALEQALGVLAEEDRNSLGLLHEGPRALGATHRKRKQRALSRLREIWRSIYGES